MISVTEEGVTPKVIEVTGLTAACDVRLTIRAFGNPTNPDVNEGPFIAEFTDSTRVEWWSINRKIS